MLDTPLTWRSSPVDGDDVPQSRTLFLVSMAALLFASAVFAAGITHAVRNLHTGGRNDPGVFGVLMLGACGIALPYSMVRLIWLWRRQQSLRIGRDRIQFLERGTVVTGEIPFANIAEVVLQPRPRSSAALMLRLVDPMRADWFWPQPRGFREFLRSAEGCDVLVCHETGFALSASALHRKLSTRWQANRTEGTDFRPD